MSDKFKVVFLSSLATLAGLHFKQVLIPCTASSLSDWVLYAALFTTTFLCLFFLIAEWRKTRSHQHDIILIAASCFIIVTCLKDIYASQSLTGQTIYFVILALAISLLSVILRRWKK